MLDEVELVQHDDRGQAGLLGHHEHPADQFVGERGFAGDQDDHLGEICREHLAAVVDCAGELGGAWGDHFDHALVGRTARHLDAVPANRLHLAPAHLAAQQPAIIDPGEAFAAVPCHYGGVEQRFAHAVLPQGVKACRARRIWPRR